MDTITNQTTGIELTPHVISVNQVIDINQIQDFDLRGIPHIQNIGIEHYTLTVEFVSEIAQRSLILSAFRRADLIRIVNDDDVYLGYMSSLKFDERQKTLTHQRGTMTLLEEVPS